MNLENNKNAYLGMNVETLFKNSILDQPKLIEKIKEIYKIEGRFLNANKSGIVGGKSDVRLAFACGHYIDANIKAYKQDVAFNQLTRTTIKKFSNVMNLNEANSKELKMLIINKAKDTKNQLFPIKYQNKWQKFFENNAQQIIKWGFSYSQSREIIVLFNRDTNTFRIYSMKKTLVNLSKNIQFTKKGNVDIGNCVFFQRKGGNGEASKSIPKADIKHPGNNIQLKIKIGKFIEEMKAYLIGIYSI